MAQLTTEQLIYLLYASAYAEAETVTKGTVKSYLSDEWKGKAEEIYGVLQAQGLIKQTSKGRFSVTEQGFGSLVTNLSTTDYQFSSVKGPKVLNTLLSCVKKAHPQSNLSEEMTFGEFQEKFKALYFEERRDSRRSEALLPFKARNFAKNLWGRTLFLRESLMTILNYSNRAAKSWL